MFRKNKNKETEEELENDLFDEKDENLEDSSADEEKENKDEDTQDPPDEEDQDESDDENEDDEEPEEISQQQPKKILVKQTQSTDEDDSEDTDTDDLFEPEGELAIDVYQTDSDIVIQSAIAGVKSEEIDISVENDIVTIRGTRKNPEQNEDKQYFHEECFWGPFSRQIFLPEEIDTQNVQASLKDGILILRLPRIGGEKTKKVKLKKK